jgi:hypothetical protein
MGLEVNGCHTEDASAYSQSHISSENYTEINKIDDKARKEEFSVEQLFASSGVPSWLAQMTVRGLIVSTFLGFLFSVITLKLSLTTGVIPSLNISAGLLGFFFVKLYTIVLSKFGISHKPFTRQENTVIQTCVVACYGLAFSGKISSLTHLHLMFLVYFVALFLRVYPNV